MHYFKIKPIHVEAAQWHPEASEDSLPAWLKPSLYGTILGNQGTINRNGDSLQVSTRAGTVMARPGEWVVYYKDTTQEFSVFSDVEFKRTFERDERKARIRAFRSPSPELITGSSSAITK